MVARVVFVVILARLLGPEDYGLFNYGLSWYLLFLPLSTLGIDAVLVREIGRKPGSFQRLVNASYALRGIASAVAAAACFLGGLLVEMQADTRLLLLIFSIALIGRGLGQWATAVLQGVEASRFVLLLEAVFRVLEVAVGIAFLLNGFGLLTLAIVHAVAWLAYGVFGVALVRSRFMPGLRAAWHSDSMLRLVTAGVPLLIGAFALGWMRQGSLVLFKHFDGDMVSLGQVALAVQVFVIAGAVFGQLGAAAIPVLSRSSDRGDGNVAIFVDSVIRAGWVLAGLMAVGALTLGDTLTSRVFGDDYALAGSLLVWSAAATGALFWVDTLASTQVAKGEYRTFATAGVVGAAVFGMSFLPLSGALGVHGLFLAILLGLIVCASIQLWHVARCEKLDWGVMILRPAVSVVVGVGISQLLLSVGGVWAWLTGSLGILLAATLLGVTPMNYWRAVVSHWRPHT